MRRILVAGGVLAACALAPASLAGQRPDSARAVRRDSVARAPVMLDAIVVTAARREQRLKDAVVTIELVTRRELEQSGSSDVAGALVGRTGVQLDGGVPSGSGLLLQGFGSQRVLVLLDGQPLAGRINGNFDVSRLPTAMIERVEVVKGPQSTLYGSDAIGGVVNLITRQPDGAFDAHAQALAGSEGRREVAAGAAGGAARLGYTLNFGYRTVDLAPGIPGDAGTNARRVDAAPRLRWKPNSAFAVDGSALLVVERQRYRTGQLFRFADNTLWSGRVGATWQRNGRRLVPLFSYSRFGHLSRSALGPVPVSDSGASDVQQLLQAEVTYTGPAPANGLLDAGLTLKREAISADRVSGGLRALRAAEPFAQATWGSGPVTVTTGARLSWSEQWGTSLAPRLNALWRPRERLALRAGVGRGYRAPDFKELYLDFVNAAAGYAVVGNPNLRPERSLNVTLGAEWAGDRVYARAGVFRNRFTDFIETGEPDVSGTYSYANIARGTTQGVEIEGAITFGTARAEVGYSRLDARDERTGGRLLGRAPHTARMLLSVGSSSGRRGSVGATYTGTTPVQRDAQGNVTRERAALLRVDLRVVQPLPLSLEAVAAVENLLDDRAGVDWPGFTGRRFTAGLAWRSVRR